MILRKNPKISLRLKYQKTIEIASILTLLILIGVFQGWKKFEEAAQVQHKVDIVFDAEEIPQTEQVKRAPAPSRPAVPIESEDEDIPEDETIDTTELDLAELPPPPPPPEDEVDASAAIFVAFDEPAQPIGGFAAIQKKLKYPEIARKAGIEGRVILQVQVKTNGTIGAVQVLQSLGNNGCDEAAIAAVKAVKWKPAMQRDQPVQVWCSIPVVFRLK